MKLKSFWKDYLLAAAVGLLLAALLALTQPGDWFLGWLAFSALLVPGMLALVVLWRWVGSGKALFWFILIALLLRIGVGVALEKILPVAGSGSDSQSAGYVFYDAYHRDTQAWSLAESGQPILKAFSKSYSMDQYGGLLAVSALAYRFLSPDTHRPLLIIVLAALAAAAGVVIGWKAARLTWGEAVATPAALLLALYPESILQGSAQMREPFLITFVMMTFLGAVLWQSARRSAWAWLASGLVGMLLFSPGVAVFTLIVLAGWLWLRSEKRRLPWRTVLIGLAVLVVALLLLWAGLARGSLAGKSPVEVLSRWLGLSSQWDIYLLEQSSGWVQKLFDEMPSWLRLPFVMGYGLAQPVLPAAIADPTWWPWKVIGILRSAGWYAFAPFLLYSLFAIFKGDKRERPAWLWLWILTWVWMILSAVRAGADQWDNPRYRIIFLFLQVALAGFAWAHQRAQRDPWLGRIFVVEGIFLVFFGEWYASRYLGSFGKLPFGWMVLCIAFLSAVVIVGGWWVDRRKQGTGPTRVRK